MKKIIGIILVVPAILLLIANAFLRMYEFYENFGLFNLFLTTAGALLIIGCFGFGIYLIVTHKEDK